MRRARMGIVSARVSRWEEREGGKYVTKQDGEEMVTVNMTTNSFTHNMNHWAELWCAI